MTKLDETLDRLAAFEPSPFPVLSLFLDATPDGAGRDHSLEIAQKLLSRKADTYEKGTEERDSFEADEQRILALLESDEGVRASAKSLAIFACQGADLFEVIELDAPVQRSRLVAGVKPDLFPLAWMDDRYSRYAVLLADSEGARLFVFGLGRLVDEEEVDGDAVRTTKAGGWSQGRYQRRRENARLDNLREAIESLEEIARDEKVTGIILAGDSQIVAQMREELPQQLEELVMDDLALEQNAPVHEILEDTLVAFRSADEQEDEDRAKELVNEFRADGLAVVGLSDTLDAVLQGQAEEVLLRGPATEIKVDRIEKKTQALIDGQLEDEGADTRDLSAKMADLVITQARKTGAEVRFLENETALTAVGGIGAFLRYRV